MENRIITLCYRKIIDVNNQKPWDKMVFEDSYNEFKIQAQLYNPDNKLQTFSALLQQSPEASKLHYLVSGAVINYLRNLNDIIPDIANNIGKQFLTFKQFKFEIVNSDLRNMDKHVVAISFYSTPLRWHDTVGQFLLTSPLQQEGDEVLTDMFSIQPFLTIHSIK